MLLSRYNSLRVPDERHRGRLSGGVSWYMRCVVYVRACAWCLFVLFGWTCVCGMGGACQYECVPVYVVEMSVYAVQGDVTALLCVFCLSDINMTVWSTAPDRSLVWRCIAHFILLCLLCQ
jgi:hypothetical protein